MSRKPRPILTTSMEVNRLKGRRKGAILKEQAWFEDGKVTDYSLAYINLHRFSRDNGRVLGYDNSHGFHHRLNMGRVEAIEFISYEAIVERFIKEVHELWRIEDEED